MTRWGAALGSFLLVAACEAEVPAEHQIAGADPRAGAVLIAQFGCGACHRVPGIRGAKGAVGPPLDGFGRRGYVAGRIPNVPDGLVRWLVDPKAIDPETVMPRVGLDDAQARHVAAYLYTLR